MREILFRGKRVDTGKWVEGCYIKECYDGRYRGLSAYEHHLISLCNGDVKYSGLSSPELKSFLVDPSTIGQYTGLTDKNGKRVFIGDIVRCSRGCPHEVIWLDEYGGTFIGGMPAIYLSGLLDGYAWTEAEEVIGNIHDNPELLEVSK